MRLSEVRAAVEEYARGLDPSLLSTADAAAAVRELATVEGVVAAAKARLAARAAAAEAWQPGGIAREARVSPRQARDLVATGKRLEDLPAVREAAERGELAAGQVALVADAAAADPSSAQRLLDAARRVSLGELRTECQRVKAAADPDPEGRRARIHAARSLKTWTDPDGTGNLRVKDTPERIAQITAGLAGVRDELFQQARKEGRRERADALDADALVETIRRAGAGEPAGRSPVKILVRVDWDALLRGHPVQGEVCELMGQPIAVSAVQDMIAAGGFVAGIVTKGKQVAGVAHLGRAPTAHQQSALEWLYPTCAAEGCNRATRLERDHRQAWAKSKITLLDLLDLLCSHHHAMKTRENWALVHGEGTRPFVPPSDPGHPRHPSPAA